VIVYEVNLEVDAAVFADYCAWLDEHVREILALPGFIAAEIFERSDPPAAAGQRCLCVSYRLAGAADLERYLRDDAPRMRAASARFAGRFTATRRVLEPCAVG
jgi:hypothetical protein